MESAGDGGEPRSLARGRRRAPVDEYKRLLLRIEHGECVTLGPIADRRIRRAKRRARSELSVSSGGWSKHELRSRPELTAVDDAMLRSLMDLPDARWSPSSPPGWESGSPRTIDRVDGRTLTTESFQRDYEAPLRPVLIEHLTDAWPASSLWSVEGLLRLCPRAEVKVGADDDGYPVLLRLRDLLYYALGRDPETHAIGDDHPLYAFDGAFAARKRGARGLAAHYAIPSPPFGEDLLALAGSRRPPHRWICLGPARSGTGAHLDPLATSAWNALLSGTKLWALWPPGTPRRRVRPAGLGSRPAARWFGWVLGTYPLPDEVCRRVEEDVRREGAWGAGGTGVDGSREANGAPPAGDATGERGEAAGAGAGERRRAAGTAASSTPSSSATRSPPRSPFARPLLFLQQAGDTVFVPRGWHHAVLNLDMTVSVTHNYCSSVNFEAVFRHARAGRPKMTRGWLRRLRAERPDLAAEADRLVREEAVVHSDTATDSDPDSDDSSSTDSGEETEGIWDNEGKGEWRVLGWGAKVRQDPAAKAASRAVRRARDDVTAAMATLEAARHDDEASDWTTTTDADDVTSGRSAAASEESEESEESESEKSDEDEADETDAARGEGAPSGSRSASPASARCGMDVDREGGRRTSPAVPQIFHPPRRVPQHIRYASSSDDEADEDAGRGAVLATSGRGSPRAAPACDSVFSVGTSTPSSSENSAGSAQRRVAALAVDDKSGDKAGVTKRIPGDVGASAGATKRSPADVGTAAGAGRRKASRKGRGEGSSLSSSPSSSASMLSDPRPQTPDANPARRAAGSAAGVRPEPEGPASPLMLERPERTGEGTLSAEAFVARFR